MGFPVFIAGRLLLGERHSESLFFSVQAGENIKYNQPNKQKEY